MTIRNFTLSLFILLSISTQAQDWSTDSYKYGEQYAGYIIDMEGNKIEGFIKYRNRWVMQNEVIFYKKKDNTSTKTKYLVKDLVEYKVADKLYHCINYAGGKSIAKRGNLVINKEGCVKEYLWYDRASSYTKMKLRPGETSEELGDRKFPSTVVFYKKGDGMGVTKGFFKVDFSKKAKAYFSENKIIAKKIKTGAEGYTKPHHIPAIIKEYNESCK